MWQESLHIFLQQFSPAATLAESTHQYSTRQIKTMLEEHTGAPVESADLYTTLKERGFFYGGWGSLELEWLFVLQE